MVAKKTSGAYSKAIDDETLKKILEVIESGPRLQQGFVISCVRGYQTMWKYHPRMFIIFDCDVFLYE
jgi:hypothetical protein